MRKMIMMALAGFIWKKIQERSARPKYDSGAVRRP
jgi:hypothetical protein